MNYLVKILVMCKVCRIAERDFPSNVRLMTAMRLYRDAWTVGFDNLYDDILTSLEKDAISVGIQCRWLSEIANRRWQESCQGT